MTHDRDIWGRIIRRSLFFLVAGASLAAQPSRNDYADDTTWLCRPGRHDACAVDLTTTVVTVDGRLKRQVVKPNPNAPVDCFYVYPTVSRDSNGNSDMHPGLAGC